MRGVGNDNPKVLTVGTSGLIGNSLPLPLQSSGSVRERLSNGPNVSQTSQGPAA